MDKNPFKAHQIPPTSLVNLNLEDPRVVAMTSREIARVLDSRHDNVKVTVDRLVAKGVIDKPAMQEYLDAQGRSGQTEYVLNKRSSIIVAAQLSPEYTAKIVDKLDELDKENKALKLELQTHQLRHLETENLSLHLRLTAGERKPSENNLWTIREFFENHGLPTDTTSLGRGSQIAAAERASSGSLLLPCQSLRSPEKSKTCTRAALLWRRSCKTR